MANVSAVPQPAVPQPGESPVPRLAGMIERVIIWIGSPASLLVHTVAFVASFAVALAGAVHWDTMLLVLTTVVSLEAIYLAIFIQFSVNKQAASLKGVEEDVESIQEDVEELGEHVEDIREDVEEIHEDIGEDAAGADRQQRQAEMLEALTNDVRAMLKHLESLKAGR